MVFPFCARRMGEHLKLTSKFALAHSETLLKVITTKRLMTGHKDVIRENALKKQEI